MRMDLEAAVLEIVHTSKGHVYMQLACIDIWLSYRSRSSTSVCMHVCLLYGRAMKKKLTERDWWAKRNRLEELAEKIDLSESDMANSTAVVTESDAVVYGHRLVAALISYWLCFK